MELRKLFDDLDITRSCFDQPSLNATMWLEKRSCNQVCAARPVIQAFKAVVGKLKPRRQLGFATPFPSRSEQHLSLNFMNLIISTTHGVITMLSTISYYTL